MFTFDLTAPKNRLGAALYRVGTGRGLSSGRWDALAVPLFPPRSRNAKVASAPVANSEPKKREGEQLEHSESG